MNNKELSEELLFTIANELNNRHDWTFDSNGVKAATVVGPNKLNVLMEDGRAITCTLSQETP